MGYINNNTGYREGILENRAIIKRGNFAYIPQDGLVNNSIAGFENMEITIMSTPRLGANFVDYVGKLFPGGGNKQGFGGDGVETFIYCLEGSFTAKADEEAFELKTGSYLYVPPTKKMYFVNNSKEDARFFLYKKRYQAADGYEPYVVHNNIENIEPIKYEDMQDVDLWNLLPSDWDFDMNFHILTFHQGASHGYVETHFQEHGALILEGEGMYNLDNNWMPVEKGDYIFMGAYSLQCAYSVGRKGPLSYLYSKDANRDVEI